MARRITTGKVGRQILGSIVAQDNSLKSVINNEDVILDPNGTGISRSTSAIQVDAANELRLADSDSSNYVALKSPATVASNITYTLPGSGVTADYVLTTDASGNLSWTEAFVGITDLSIADNATYYPALLDSATGTGTTLNVSSTRLSYIPNPGRLTVRYLTVNQDATISNDLTVAADLSAATITETSSIVYKENVNPIVNALDSILKLQGVTYDRKGTEHKGEAGLIAEEVAPVIPNVVAFKDGKPEGINYTKLTAYLIEAVKTLKDEIDTLKRK